MQIATPEITSQSSQLLTRNHQLSSSRRQCAEPGTPPRKSPFERKLQLGFPRCSWEDPPSKVPDRVRPRSQLQQKPWLFLHTVPREGQLSPGSRPGASKLAAPKRLTARQSAGRLR